MSVKPAARRGGLELVLRPPVRVRIVVDEEGGAAEDDAARRFAHLRRAGLPQEAQETGDDVGEQVALQAHLGFLLEQRRAENALERPHQPAGIVGEMAPHRLAPIGDAVVLE